MSEELKAGRVLDELIAVRVMGFSVLHDAQGYPMHQGASWSSWASDWERGHPPVVTGPPIPHYSTDIVAAWMVVDALAGKSLGGIGGTVLGFGLERTDGPRWSAAFGSHAAHAFSAPLAICRAALKALAAPTNSEVKP